MGRINFSPQIAQLNNGSAGAQLQSNAIDTMVKAVSDYAKGDGQTKEQRELAKLQLEDALLRKEKGLTNTTINTAKINNENLERAKKEDEAFKDVILSNKDITTETIKSNNNLGADKVIDLMFKDYYANAGSVKDANTLVTFVNDYNTNKDRLSKDQQVAVQSVIDSKAKILADTYDPKGTYDKLGKYWNADLANAVAKVNKDVYNPKNETMQEKAIGRYTDQISTIINDKSIPQKIKDKKIAELKTSYKKEFDANKDAWLKENNDVHASRDAKVDELIKKDKDIFDTVRNLASVEVKKDIDASTATKVADINAKIKADNEAQALNDSNSITNLLNKQVVTPGKVLNEKDYYKKTRDLFKVEHGRDMDVTEEMALEGTYGAYKKARVEDELQNDKLKSSKQDLTIKSQQIAENKAKLYAGDKVDMDLVDSTVLKGLMVDMGIPVSSYTDSNGIASKTLMTNIYNQKKGSLDAIKSTLSTNVSGIKTKALVRGDITAKKAQDEIDKQMNSIPTIEGKLAYANSMNTYLNGAKPDNGISIEDEGAVDSDDFFKQSTTAFNNAYGNKAKAKEKAVEEQKNNLGLLTARYDAMLKNFKKDGTITDSEKLAISKFKEEALSKGIKFNY